MLLNLCAGLLCLMAGVLPTLGFLRESWARRTARRPVEGLVVSGDPFDPAEDSGRHVRVRYVVDGVEHESRLWVTGPNATAARLELLVDPRRPRRPLSRYPAYGRRWLVAYAGLALLGAALTARSVEEVMARRGAAAGPGEWSAGAGVAAAALGQIVGLVTLALAGLWGLGTLTDRAQRPARRVLGLLVALAAAAAGAALVTGFAP